MTRRGGQLVLVGVPDVAQVPSVLERLYYSARTIMTDLASRTATVRRVIRFDREG